MSKIQAVPTEEISRATRTRLLPETFPTAKIPVTPKLVRFVGNTITAMVFATAMAIPTAATAYAMTAVSDSEVVSVVRNQDVPYTEMTPAKP
jgi:hypothetical protein